MDFAVWVAAAAAAVAVIALGACLALWIALRRVRGAQKVLLPDGASVGLVDRQATLQRAQGRLEQGLADLESLVERQGEVTERSLRSALRFQGMVRYDAYRDMGGNQSWSIALIDGNQTGAVVTSLHARDHARVYLKELVEGVPGQRLSPEETRAVGLATGAPPRPPKADAGASEEAAPPAEPPPAEPAAQEEPTA
jgi:Protein of unknown function (DUF4446)